MATYVNFIHQKDAFIAMKVVEKFTNETERRAPVYTVHYNWITTSILADRISTEVFMEMGHPLVILNEFMKKNLDPLERGEESNTHIVCQDLIRPIQSHSIRSLFMDQRPKNWSVKDEIIWDRKVEKVVSCNEKYVTTVDGGGALDGGMIHTDKWYLFHSKQKSWEASPNNYSLH